MVHIVLIVLLCTAGITTAAPLTTIQAALSSASNAADLVKKIFGRTTSVSVSEIQKDIGFNRIMRAAVHLKGTARSHAGMQRSFQAATDECMRIHGETHNVPLAITGPSPQMVEDNIDIDAYVTGVVDVKAPSGRGFSAAYSYWTRDDGAVEFVVRIAIVEFEIANWFQWVYTSKTSFLKSSTNVHREEVPTPLTMEHWKIVTEELLGGDVEAVRRLERPPSSKSKKGFNEL